VTAAEPIATVTAEQDRAATAEPPTLSVVESIPAAAPTPGVMPVQPAAVAGPDQGHTVPAAAAENDAIADMLAALPKPLETGSSVDPFEPFPYVVTDEAPPPRETTTPEIAGLPAASVVHETLYRSDAPALAAVLDDRRAADPAAIAALHGRPPVAAPTAWRPQFVPASASASGEAPTFEASDRDSAAPAPAMVGEHSATAGDRRPAVLTYDEVHRTVAERRSKTPFVWAAAVLIVLAVAGVVGGPKVRSLLKGAGKPADAARPPAGAVEPGGFKITTQPPGSRITIDGTERGTAPIRVDDLAPGLHSIVVESDWGKLEEAVTVEAGRVVPLALATVGWIRVEAPVELEVSEEGRSFGVTGQALMVPAGRHAFVFSNRSVAVRQRHFVQVPAGQTVKVVLDLPKGMLNLTSDQPAQVLLDGQLVGDTPQVSIPAALGPHEVLFRSARHGEVSYSVNVTLAAPVSLTASFATRR
jgi:hypothetical protein